jgi:hypothetical protein
MYDYKSDPKKAAVVKLLAASHPALLSRDEIRREIGDRIVADDALCYLERVGLVHCLGDFFWLTRTAMAAEEVVTAPVEKGAAR